MRRKQNYYLPFFTVEHKCKKLKEIMKSKKLKIKNEREIKTLERRKTLDPEAMEKSLKS